MLQCREEIQGKGRPHYDVLSFFCVGSLGREISGPAYSWLHTFAYDAVLVAVPRSRVIISSTSS